MTRQANIFDEPVVAGVTPPPASDTLLRYADARVIGDDLTDDIDGVLGISDLTAQATSLATLQTILIWDTGLTVDDIICAALDVQLLNLSIGLNSRVCMAAGFMWATSLAAAAPASSPSHWNAGWSGNGAGTPGTTVGLQNRSGNASPAFSGSTLANATRMYAFTSHILRGTTPSATTHVALANGTTNNREFVTDASTRTGTHRLLAFFGAGRSAAALPAESIGVSIGLSVGRKTEAT